MQIKNGAVNIYDLSSITGLTIANSTGGTLTVGTTYYYVISAIYPTGESVKSTQISRSGANAYQLNWAACVGATSYRIYRSTLAGGPHVYYTSTTNSYKDIKASGSVSGTPLNSLVGLLNIVIGLGTNWITGVTPVQIGNTFKIAGENAIYQVGLINSDTQITLTSNYLGTSKVNSAYQITKDFTPNLGLAELSRGDVDLEYHLTQQVIRPLDTIIANMGESLNKSVYQVGHGFLAKDVIRHDGTNYVKAKADTEANSAFVGIVTQVIDSDNFKIVLGGYVSGLTGLTAGVTYYLSAETAGLLTPIPPALSKPVLRTNSDTSGYFASIGGSPEVVTDASSLITGTLADERLSSAVTKLGNTFNGNSQLVKTTADGKLPALDGSLLTGVATDVSGKEDTSNKNTSAASLTNSATKYVAERAMQELQALTKPHGITLLGDSRTYGTPVPADAWGQAVFDTFSSNYPGINLDVQNKGVSGENTNDVLARLKTDVLDTTTNTVVLQIGANDASSIILWTQHVDIVDFDANMRNIIDQIQQRGKTVILVVTSGVWEAAPSFTGVLTNDMLAPYQQMIRDLAAELHLELIDLSAMPQDGTYFQNDGTHWDVAGNEYAYNLTMPVLLRVFGINDGKIKPYADSTTAVQIQHADETPLITVDTLNGYTGFGTDTPKAKIHIHNSVVDTGSVLFTDPTTFPLIMSNQDSAVSFDFVVADGTGTPGYRGSLRGTRARGTLASPAVPLANDFIFTLAGGIYDGAAVLNTAEVALKVDGTVSSGVAPQRIAFSTSPTNATGKAERVTIKSDGKVGINNTTPSTTLDVGGDVTATAYYGNGEFLTGINTQHSIGRTRNFDISTTNLILRATDSFVTITGTHASNYISLGFDPTFIAKQAIVLSNQSAQALVIDPYTGFTLDGSGVNVTLPVGGIREITLAVGSTTAWYTSGIYEPGTVVTVVDSLDSTSSTSALSANMGNTLGLRIPLITASNIPRMNSGATAYESSGWNSTASGMGFGETATLPITIYSTSAGPIIRSRDEVTSAFGGGYFVGAHNNASNALPAVGDLLSTFAGGYLDGATARNAAQINMLAATGIATGAGGRYGALSFRTANGGAPAERLLITSAGYQAVPMGGAVASASTIAPTGVVFHVTGTTTINTITAPTLPTTSACQITIIPDGIFTTGVIGNIAMASTAVVSKALIMVYDVALAKWYPSY